MVVVSTYTRFIFRLERVSPQKHGKAFALYLYLMIAVRRKLLIKTPPYFLLGFNFIKNHRIYFGSFTRKKHVLLFIILPLIFKKPLFVFMVKFIQISQPACCIKMVINHSKLHLKCTSNIKV